MKNLINEKAFEEAIGHSLVTNGGYVRGDAAQFGREFALDTQTLFKFIQGTQKETWDQLVLVHGADGEIKASLKEI